MFGMYICAIIKEDRHFADAGLKPFRWCESNVKWILSRNQGYGDLIKKIVAFVALIFLGPFIGLISLVPLALKKCCPVDHFTPREALLQNSKFTVIDGPSATAIDCDLRSGILVVWLSNGERGYWEPGLDSYGLLKDRHVTKGGFIISRNGEIIGGKILSLGEAEHIYPKLSLQEVKKLLEGVEFDSASYAPVLGIIIAHMKGKIFYHSPGMKGFAILPSEGFLVPTGGKIRSDGTVEEEPLIPV